jgi:hypothetical protein
MKALYFSGVPSYGVGLVNLSSDFFAWASVLGVGEDVPCPSSAMVDGVDKCHDGGMGGVEKLEEDEIGGVSSGEVSN